MTEQPRSAVLLKDGRACYELTAAELVFRIETANPSKPIYFHMRPYAFEEIRAALRALKPKIKDVGSTIISEEGDAAALLPLFDKTFLQMVNVRLRAGDDTPPPVDEQKTWLDRNPRLKARVINEGFCLVFFMRTDSTEASAGVVVNDRPVDEAVVLEDLLPLDSGLGAKVEYFYRLHSIETKETHPIALAHQFAPETSRDYYIYDRASRREIEKSSGYSSLDVEHDSLNKLYDRTVLSLDGCLVNGEPCSESNKKDWVAKVPYYLKKIALDARFEDVTKKNG